MVVFPGGGYSHLAEHEGKGYAEWLAERGIAAYVLKYRLGSSGYRHPTMLNDAARAVRLVIRSATASACARSSLLLRKARRVNSPGCANRAPAAMQQDSNKFITAGPP